MLLTLPIKTLVLLPLILLTVACSNNGRFPGQTPVIVDTKGVDMARYEADVSDCEAYAQQVNVSEKAAVQGATGAVVGGVLGAIFDDRHTGAGEGAAAGAVLGSVKGASRGFEDQSQVLRRCLRGRGYKVLS